MTEIIYIGNLIILIVRKNNDINNEKQTKIKKKIQFEILDFLNQIFIIMFTILNR